MSTVTKFEMDEKLSKMNNLMMSFMDYTNDKMKRMEEEIKQNKNKIASLEKELNETKNTNQEYKHKIYILENDLIYGINRKLEVIDDHLDEIDGQIDETVDERDEIDKQIDKKFEVIVNNLDNRFNNKIVDMTKKINKKTNAMNTKPTKIYNKKQVITSVINKIMTDNNKKHVVINDRLNKFDEEINKKYNILVGRFHKIHELIVEIDKNSCKNNNDIIKELNIMSKNYNTLLNKRLNEIDEEKCQNHNSLAKFVNELAERINKTQQTTSSSNDESNGFVKFEYDGEVYFKTPDNLLYDFNKQLVAKIHTNNDVIFYDVEEYERINKTQQTTSSSNDESNSLVKFEYDGVVYFKTPDNLLYNEKRELMGKINSNNDVVLLYDEEEYDSDESEDSSEEDD
jgi:hypothetical protein